MKTNFLNLLKDWKFWYKFIFMLLMLATMITSFTNSLLDVKDDSAFSIFDKNGLLIGKDYISWFIQWITYFTNQSNLIILVYFIFALIRHSKEGSTFLTNFYLTNAFATYISVTFLTYNLMLLPTSIESVKSYNSTQWFINAMTHMVGPIVAVIYIILISPKNNLVDTKIFIKKYSWKYILYPIVYCLVVLAIAGVYIASGKLDISGYPIVPYFFLEIWNKNAMAGIPGYVWFISAVILISLICFGGSILYNKIANFFSLK